MNEDRLDWHTAFYDALQLELEQYSDFLQFDFEHKLNTEPLIIDAVVIKKTRDVAIEKNIANIFRTTNIIEYKSPEDFLSVTDFHKAIAYTHLYCATVKGVLINDITLSFVLTRNPREVLKHIKNECRYRVSSKNKGIYVIEGDIIPMQIIETKLLSEEDNMWLKDLNKDLDLPRLSKMLGKSLLQERWKRIRAYISTVLKANLNILEEMKMNETKKFYDMLERTGTFADKDFHAVLERAGIFANFEANGFAKGEAKILDLWKSGKTYEEAVQIVQSKSL